MSRTATFFFVCVALLWGVPYLFIEIAVEDGASPILVGWGRVAIGAAILLPIAWKLGYLEGLRSKTKPLVAFAIVECALPWWLIPLGQQEVSSSLAAILIASLPIITAIVALRFAPGRAAERLPSASASWSGSRASCSFWESTSPAAPASSSEPRRSSPQPAATPRAS